MASARIQEGLAKFPSLQLENKDLLPTQSILSYMSSEYAPHRGKSYEKGSLFDASLLRYKMTDGSWRIGLSALAANLHVTYSARTARLLYPLKEADPDLYNSQAVLLRMTKVFSNTGRNSTQPCILLSDEAVKAILSREMESVSVKTALRATCVYNLIYGDNWKDWPREDSLSLPSDGSAEGQLDPI